MDSQLSLFGFEEAPSDKKEEVNAKGSKKQATKDVAPENTLFGEDVNTETPIDADNEPIPADAEQITDEILSQEEVINTASDENIFPTTENYEISEDEYQQLDEISEDEFPWDEQETPSEDIYTDTNEELENFAAEEIKDDFSEESTIYASEEEPIFENPIEVEDVAVSETENLDDSIENIEGNSDADFLEPAPSFETEIDEQEEVESPIDTISVKKEIDLENIETDNDGQEINTTIDSEQELHEMPHDEAFQEEIEESENTEPEYIEPIPNFDAHTEGEINVTEISTEEPLSEYEEDSENISPDAVEIEEASAIENAASDSAPILESHQEEVVENETSQHEEGIITDEHIDSAEEISLDYPDFWDEKVEVETTPEVPEAKDLFGEVIVPTKKEVFKAGKRGRKSFKEIDAEVDLIDVPEDDVLFSKQYYPISEVAKWFRVNNSLLRFWENEFDILKPRKNRKGDRLFRPEDIKNLQVIYYLLRNKKYTIDGAKKYLKTNKKTADINLQIIHALNNFIGFLLELKANVS